MAFVCSASCVLSSGLGRAGPRGAGQRLGHRAGFGVPVQGQELGLGFWGTPRL